MNRASENVTKGHLTGHLTAPLEVNNKTVVLFVQNIISWFGPVVPAEKFAFFLFYSVNLSEPVLSCNH